MAREEKVRKEQEARMKAEREMRERRKQSEELRAKAQKEKAEREAKCAREAEAVRKTQEQQEKARKAAEADRQKFAAEQELRMRKAAAERNEMLAKERIRATHVAEASARKVREARNEWPKPAVFTYGSSHSTNSAQRNCKHDKFWPKVEGSQQCSNCNAFQYRFAFRCPGYRMIACASCRQTLRGEIRKNYKPHMWSESFEDWDFNSY